MFMRALPIDGDIIREDICQEIAGIGNDRFDGLQCITITKEFVKVCLQEAILKATLIGYNENKNNNRSGTSSASNQYTMFSYKH